LFVQAVHSESSVAHVGAAVVVQRSVCAYDDPVASASALQWCVPAHVTLSASLLPSKLHTQLPVISVPSVVAQYPTLKQRSLSEAPEYAAPASQNRSLLHFGPVFTPVLHRQARLFAVTPVLSTQSLTDAQTSSDPVVARVAAVSQ
jgi:hypothetical protein